MTTKPKAKAADPVPCWQAKACPFCGWVPSIQQRPPQFMIACNHDNCHVLPSVFGKTRAQAVRRWNRRSPIPPKVPR